jgi:sialic acid synthase SpsE
MAKKVTTVVLLSVEHNQELDEAVKAVRRANVEFAAARVKFEMANLHHTETFEQLSGVYGFSPNAKMSFDEEARTLTPVAEKPK